MRRRRWVYILSSQVTRVQLQLCTALVIPTRLRHDTVVELKRYSGILKLFTSLTYVAVFLRGLRVLTISFFCIRVWAVERFWRYITMMRMERSKSRNASKLGMPYNRLESWNEERLEKWKCCMYHGDWGVGSRRLGIMMNTGSMILEEIPVYIVYVFSRGQGL